MKQMKLLVAGAVLACSISVTGAAFAKVDHSAGDYYGKTQYSWQDYQTTQAPTVEANKEETKPAVTTEEKPATSETTVEAVDADKAFDTYLSTFYGNAGTEK